MDAPGHLRSNTLLGSPPMKTRRHLTALLAISIATLTGIAFVTSAGAAEVTIGANVNQATSESGTCGFMTPAERPCTFITSVIPGQTLIAPCSGTVTRFRLNGLPKPANHYSLRVVRKNPDGSFTGTATSAEVAITAEGVNEYPTGLPIAAGEEIGIDFQDSTEEHGLRWVGGTGVSAGYFYAFPADGGSAFATGPATFYYLFNADIACATSGPEPANPGPANPGPTAPTPVPSNDFRVIKLKGTVLTLSLASKGAVTVTDAATKVKAGATSKAKPKLLKAASVSGGPGQVKVNLKLTGVAKTALRKKGKVKARAKVTFTPTGGTAASQIRNFTVREPKAANPRWARPHIALATPNDRKVPASAARKPSANKGHSRPNCAALLPVGTIATATGKNLKLNEVGPDRFGITSSLEVARGQACDYSDPARAEYTVDPYAGFFKAAFEATPHEWTLLRNREKKLDPTFRPMGTLDGAKLFSLGAAVPVEPPNLSETGETSFIFGFTRQHNLFMVGITNVPIATEASLVAGIAEGLDEEWLHGGRNG
jgi:hypothetical protein